MGAYTYEITPETDEDAYGGWWISVYSKGALDASRATAEELAAITVKRVVAESPSAGPAPSAPIGAPPVAAASSSGVYARASDGTYSAGTRNALMNRTADAAWSTADMTRSRKPTGSTGGSVYVRGYTRKDGTYISAHTRAAPGHGSSGRH